MHIHEFHAALENNADNVSFLESLRMMATSHAEQTSQGFAAGFGDDGLNGWWEWIGDGGSAFQA